MNFVIFHGSFVTPDDSWYKDVKQDLEELNQNIYIPQFPVDLWKDVENLPENTHLIKQSLNIWIAEFNKFWSGRNKDESYCFIGHSLGPLFILHMVSKYKIKLDSAIFVCPFLNELETLWQVKQANKTFYKGDFDFKELKELIPTSYVIYSDNDPYVDRNNTLDFARKLNSQTIEIKGGGHLSSWFGYDKFPLINELCKTRFKKVK